jgi:hypothetical protein
MRIWNRLAYPGVARVLILVVIDECTTESGCLGWRRASTS